MVDITFKPTSLCWFFFLFCVLPVSDEKLAPSRVRLPAAKRGSVALWGLRYVRTGESSSWLGGSGSPGEIGGFHPNRVNLSSGGEGERDDLGHALALSSHSKSSKCKVDGGLGSPPPLPWRGFSEAREIVRRQEFQLKRHFQRWKDRPHDVPYDPAGVYNGHGWSGWADFLASPSTLPSSPQSIQKSKVYCSLCRSAGASYGIASYNKTKWDTLLCRSCSVSWRNTAHLNSTSLPANPRLMKRLYKRCFECPKFASFGPMPAHIEAPQVRSTTVNGNRRLPWHCRKHALPGEIDVLHVHRCSSPGCNKNPSFGPVGGMPVACKDHRVEEHIGLRGYHCRHLEGCDVRASYGTRGMGPEFCVHHMSAKMVQITKLRCMYLEGCYKQASFRSLVDGCVYCKAHRGSNYTVNYERLNTKKKRKGGKHNVDLSVGEVNEG